MFRHSTSATGNRSLSPACRGEELVLHTFQEIAQ